MKFFNGILKWMAAFLLSLAAGVGAVAVLAKYTQFTPLATRLIVIASISFMCSLLLRIFFRKVWAIALIIIALVTASLSVLIFDFFYDSEMKLSFIMAGPQIIMPTAEEFAQLALLLVVSLPVVLLFRKKRVKKTAQVVEPRNTAPAVKPSKPAAAKPAGQSFSEWLKVAAYQINPKNWNIKLPKMKAPAAAKKKTTIKAASASSSPKVKINNTPKASMQTAPKKSTAKKPSAKKPAVKKLKLPKFGTKSANNDVKLNGEEEHVCPYCLEEVLKNDPHGVAVCKECGTWHHQDCWDITGACGVAHRNKL